MADDEETTEVTEPETTETPESEAEPKTTETPKEAEKPASKWKFKVNGEEKEFSEDDLRDAVNRADLAERSKKALQDAQESIEAAKYVVQRVASDEDLQALVELHTGRLGSQEAAMKYVAQIVTKFAEKYKLLGDDVPPEKRREFEIEQRIRALEQELKNERALRSQETAQQHQVRLEREMESSIEGLVKEIEKQGLPNDALMMRAIHEAYLDAVDEEKIITPAEAVARAKVKAEEVLLGRLKTMKLDEFKKLYPDFVKQIREADLAELKAGQTPKPMKPRPTSETPTPRHPAMGKRPFSMADIDQELSRLR